MRIFIYSVICSVLCGCTATHKYNAQGPGWYVVKPTDTLYSISWRYGLDYHDIARWNGLNDEYLIHPGQQLVLIEPDIIPQDIITQPKNDEPETAVVIRPLKPPVSITYNPPASETATSRPAHLNDPVDYVWPTQGVVKSSFYFKDLDRRGIDIAGKIGQPVYAVADGKVVYSGTGLAGYGNLIIIKHNETYLSAYAFNRNRLVKEGMQVKRGSLIAEMGMDNDRKPILHFQIRKNGKPVDPLNYLPKQ